MMNFVRVMSIVCLLGINLESSAMLGSVRRPIASFAAMRARPFIRPFSESNHSGNLTDRIRNSINNGPSASATAFQLRQAQITHVLNGVVVDPRTLPVDEAAFIAGSGGSAISAYSFLQDRDERYARVLAWRSHNSTQR
jgi:hypothetical protein